MLQERQRETLFLLLDAVQKLLDEGIDQSKLPELETEINLALALMERDFPADIQVYIILPFWIILVHLYALVLFFCALFPYLSGNHYASHPPHF